MQKKMYPVPSRNEEVIVRHTQSGLLRITGKNTATVFEKFAQHAEKTASPLYRIANDKSDAFGDDAASLLH
jgi:hypothetical protein